ncbi:hypothetical protein ACP275_13G096900 [Erythranthe tilingii]
MAGRKGELREEGKNRSSGAAAAAAAASSLSIGDALLLTTMCIVGMPVDVHAIDGSVYSGIFHTASVDEDYAVVLKKAKMIKKGNLDANVVNGALIETLVVPSEDLVQVVAKAVLLPSNGVTSNIGGDGIEAAAGYIESLDRDASFVKSNGAKANKKQKRQSRFSGKREKVLPFSDKTENLLDSSPEDRIERLDTVNSVKRDEADNIAAGGRQTGNESQEMQSNSNNNSNAEVHDSSLRKDTVPQEPRGVSEEQGRNGHTSDETPNASVASQVPVTDVKSDSRLRASSNPFLFAPPKNPTVKKTIKESKLNPGAKVFSPSVLHHRAAVSPPAVANGASVSYMPSNYTMTTMATAREEVDANSIAFSSVPVKLVPYNNMSFEHGVSDSQYGQPIIGQVMNRTQPVRYTGQYQNYQTAPSYVHPNPHNAMFGRVGPLLCMHPISNDVAQSVAGFSPANTRPLLTPHPVHLTKHQGNNPAQALQMCMNPPIIGNGAQSYVMTSSIPMPQPMFPVLRPIAVPGSNGFLNTKFA